MTTFVQPRLQRSSPPTLDQTAQRLHSLALLGLFALLVACLLFPELAFAQDAKAKIGAAAQGAYDLVFTIVYWICAIAVTVSGLGAMFGRMEWGRFGQIVAGIVVVFSATLIVDYFKA